MPRQGAEATSVLGSAGLVVMAPVPEAWVGPRRRSLPSIGSTGSEPWSAKLPGSSGLKFWGNIPTRGKSEMATCSTVVQGCNVRSVEAPERCLAWQDS